MTFDMGKGWGQRKPINRVSKRRKPMPPDVAAQVTRRSGGRCEAGTPDCRGRGEVLHHRKLRRQGGKHTVDNLMHVCGAGGCHDYIHSNVAESYRAGWLVRSTDAVVPFSAPGSIP